MADRSKKEITSPLSEFTPVSAEFCSPADEYPPVPAPEQAAEDRTKKRRLLRLAVSAALLGLIVLAPKHPAFVPAPAPVTPIPSAVPSAATPAPVVEPTAEATPVPTETPAPTEEPASAEPLVQPIFYNFSHDHRGQIRMENADRLRGVQVTVRETVLDLPVFEHELDESEIAAGFYELPALSTGDVYMDNMAAYEEKNAWPEFEMKVTYRYENAAGDGEESKELVLEPAYEMGFGASYWKPDYTWDEQLPPDSIVIRPFDDVDNIRYIFYSPNSVKDPITVYVSVEYDGRKLDPETFQSILKKDEYTMIDSASGTETPVVAYQSTLVIPRPDWVPEGGTVHITIAQMLSVTGELYTKEFDLELS